MGNGYRHDGRSNRFHHDGEIKNPEEERFSERRGEWSSEGEWEWEESRRGKGKERMRGERHNDPRDNNGQRRETRGSGRDGGRYRSSGFENTRSSARRLGSTIHDEVQHTRRDRRDNNNDEGHRSDPNRTSHQSNNKNDDGNQTRGSSRKPAGWENFFEDGRPNRSLDRLSQFDEVVSREHRAVSKDVDLSRPSSHLRRSPSPPSHASLVADSELIPPEQALPASASLDQTLSTQSSILAKSVAPPHITSDSYSSTAAGTASKPEASVSSATRTRAPRLAPIDTIRMHLQGHALRTGTALTRTKETEDDAQNPGEPRTVDQDVASSKNQRTEDASMSTTETMAPATNISPAGDEEMSLLPQDALSSSRVVLPSVKFTTSDDRNDGAQSVSYSIRGAATRLTVQPPSFIPSPIGSTQRASPGSTHSPIPVRDRLLERLEAAKAAKTIGNPHPIASHPSQKASHPPNPTDSSEPPVSGQFSANAAAEEERLRLAVRSHSARNWPTDDDSHQEESTVPAGVTLAATEVERKSRLRARLAARKRDMGAVVSAASLGDAPTR